MEKYKDIVKEWSNIESKINSIINYETSRGNIELSKDELVTISIEDKIELLDNIKIELSLYKIINGTNVNSPNDFELGLIDLNSSGLYTEKVIKYDKKIKEDLSNFLEIHRECFIRNGLQYSSPMTSLKTIGYTNSFLTIEDFKQRNEYDIIEDEHLKETHIKLWDFHNDFPPMSYEHKTWGFDAGKTREALWDRIYEKHFGMKVI